MRAFDSTPVTPARESADPEVVSLLATLAGNDPGARRAALAALRESGDPAAIPALIRLAGEPSSLAPAAGEALFAFHSLTAVVPLAAGLDAPSPASRLAVVRALGDFRSPVVERLLAHTLLEDPDPEVRREVLILPGQWRHPSTLPVLARALRDADAEVRIRAVAALSRFAPGAGVAELVSALADTDWRVRRDVVLALGRYVVPAALNALLLALGDPDRRVVRDALGSLASLRAPYAKRYAELAAHPSAEVRLALAWTLGESKDLRAQAVLAGLQNDRDESVRTAAHAALALLNDAGEVWP